jgi:hypothetical protein
MMLTAIKAQAKFALLAHPYFGFQTKELQFSWDLIVVLYLVGFSSIVGWYFIYL